MLAGDQIGRLTLRETERLSLLVNVLEVAGISTLKFADNLEGLAVEVSTWLEKDPPTLCTGCSP